MKKFKFNGSEYNIIKEYKGSGDLTSWEVKVTDQTRIRDVFAWRPRWVGNKFRFLKKIKIKERMQIMRYTDFDDGWTYQNFWKPWYSDWQSEEIL